MGYFLYKVTFIDLPCYFYYGKHKDNGKPYFGSPVTWSHLWNHFEPRLQVLQWCDTEKEVNRLEESAIKATWKDKYSLNEHCGNNFSEEVCSNNGKANAEALNVHPNTKESRKSSGRANVGIMNSHPNTSEVRKANAITMNSHPNTLGNRSVQGRSMNNHPNTLKAKKNNGRANAKSLNSQKWQCLVTGYVSSPGSLSVYQKARGIDTSQRVKLE